MTIKELITFLRGKGVEPTADDIANIETQLKESVPIKETLSLQPVISNDDNYKHNAQYINELKVQIAEQEKRFAAEREKDKTQLQAEIEMLKNILGETKIKQEAAEKAMLEKMEVEKADKIKVIIAEAVKTKIPPQNEELIKKYTALLTSDFEMGKAIIESLPPINQNSTPIFPSGGISGQATANRGMMAGASDPKILEKVLKDLNYQ